MCLQEISTPRGIGLPLENIRGSRAIEVSNTHWTKKLIYSLPLFCPNPFQPQYYSSLDPMTKNASKFAGRSSATCQYPRPSKIPRRRELRWFIRKLAVLHHVNLIAILYRFVCKPRRSSLQKRDGYLLCSSIRLRHGRSSSLRCVTDISVNSFP